MLVVVRFCHARIMNRNVDSAPHRTMGISPCGKVYSSISASFPTGTVSASLSLSDHVFHLERGGVMEDFFQESLFEWQWFSSQVVISLNMSHATSRDPFQQIKICRNPQGSKCICFFYFCSYADQLWLLNMTQLGTIITYLKFVVNFFYYYYYYLIIIKSHSEYLKNDFTPLRL